jgi:hypothetical protein
MDVIVKDTRIQSSELRDYGYKLFLRWAFANGQTKADFIRNIAVNRASTPDNVLEANRGMEHYAKLYGMTYEELDEVIARADQNGVSIVELQNRLAQGVRGEALYKRGQRGKRLQPVKDGEADD